MNSVAVRVGTENPKGAEVEHGQQGRTIAPSCIGSFPFIQWGLIGKQAAIIEFSTEF
jgi:hypothetical protein